jgi:hypothetical protein
MHYKELPSGNGYLANSLGLHKFSDLAVIQFDPSTIFGAVKALCYYYVARTICSRLRSISDESPIVELEKVRGLLPATAAAPSCIICAVSTIMELLVGPSCGTAVALPINAVTVTSINAIDT